MQRKPGVMGVITALVVAAATARAQPEIPVTVSPGDTRAISAIADRCPTFSWGAVPGARGYEVVVYRVAEDGSGARAVQTEGIPGPAQSWTPTLHSCLERGRRYAWSVRAVGEESPSEWSQASLFEVVQGPSEAEFLEALAVVEQYLTPPRPVGEAAAVAQTLGTTPTAPVLPPVTGAPALAAYGDSCCNGNQPAAYSSRLGNTSTGSHPDVLALELPSKTDPDTSMNYIGFFDWDSAKSEPRLIGEIEAWRPSYPADSLLRFTGSASISGWTRTVGNTQTCGAGVVCSDFLYCPEDDQAALSGGFEILGGNTVGLRLFESSPSFPDWHVHLNNTVPGTSFTWRIVVICAEVGAD